MDQPPYTYEATVVRVIDGDTAVFDVSLGFGFWSRSTKRTPQSFRLAGCNAREKSAPGGKEARDHLTALLPPGTQVLLRSVVNDKFGGRYDVHITCPDVGDLVPYLIAEDWAAEWDGRGVAPVPPWPRPGTPG